MEEYKLTVTEIIDVINNHNSGRNYKAINTATDKQLSIEHYLKENYFHKKI